jgi:hypothetical protein
MIGGSAGNGNEEAYDDTNGKNHHSWFVQLVLR